MNAGKRKYHFFTFANRQQALELEIEEELRFHIEMSTQNKIAMGMSPEAAYLDAVQCFGDFEHIKQSCLEIERERRADSPGRKILKFCCWLVLAGGVIIRLWGANWCTVDQILIFQHMGSLLIFIALAGWVFITLQSLKPMHSDPGRGRNSFLM